MKSNHIAFLVRFTYLRFSRPLPGLYIFSLARFFRCYFFARKAIRLHCPGTEISRATASRTKGAVRITLPLGFFAAGGAFDCGTHGTSCSYYKSGRPDLNRRRPAWEAGILPLNYARLPKKRNPGLVLLSHGIHRSTIGAGELNGRVRDGNGCGLSAIETGVYSQCGVL